MDQNHFQQNSVHQETVLAGKRKYFFDIRETRDGDYYITITERKKVNQSMESGGERGDHQRFRIFLYKEDLNKFTEAFLSAGNKLKELLPDFDFTSFDKGE